MNNYRIEEIRETLNNGEVMSAFYIFKPFLFFWRKYDSIYYNGERFSSKRRYGILENAINRVMELTAKEKELWAQKTKKKETIIHKL